MTLKSMMKIYYYGKASLDIWKAFCEMWGAGEIKNGVWDKFYDRCKDWVWDEEKQAVIEMFTGKVVRI